MTLCSGYVIFVSVCNLLIAGYCLYLAREVRLAHRLLDKAMMLGADQHLIIQAMLSKGIEVRCDYCHNPMAPNVPIEVVPQDDGTVWVQHKSHGVG